MIKKQLLLLYLFCHVTSLLAEKSEPKSDVWLTVFVHGIMSVRYHISFPNIVLFIRDKVADSAYQKTVEIIRNDPYFHQTHPVQEAGLKKIDLSLEQPGAASSLFARLWETIDTLNNQELKETIYYTYGWTGLLSPMVRRFEANILCNSLLKELGTYHKQNIYPKIRIVGYSHGGNVALEMAHYCYPTTLKIDELVLIGVPVVKTNDFLISHRMFKKIYHIYSRGDRVQNLDLLTWQRWFYEPRGRCKHYGKLPKNLTQVELRIKRLTDYHKQGAPKTCDGAILNYRRKALRVADPGHTELWSFGWGSSAFSKFNPYTPLPAGLFAPFIINELKKEPVYNDHCIADIYSHERRLYLRHHHKNDCKKIDFISQQQLDSMFTLAECYKPENYSIEDYDARVDQAKKEGRRLALLEINRAKAIRSHSTRFTRSGRTAVRGERPSIHPSPLLRSFAGHSGCTDAVRPDGARSASRGKRTSPI